MKTAEKITQTKTQTKSFKDCREMKTKAQATM